MENFYTVKEAADRLKVCQMTIYRAVNSGKLRSVVFGHTIRVPESAIEEYLQPKVNPAPASIPRNEIPRII